MNLRFKNGVMSQIKEEHLLETITPIEFAQQISKMTELTKQNIEDAIKFNLKSYNGVIRKFNTYEKDNRNLIQTGYLIINHEKEILAALEMSI